MPTRAAGRTVVDVRGVRIGGPELALVGGPCGVESREQLFTVARYVAEAGAKLLRGGAFKPRTSPYAFQGLGEEGLQMLAEARGETRPGHRHRSHGPARRRLVAQYADMLQIGARNMQNFALLSEVGRTDKPVLLKRGLGATVEEWLMRRRVHA